MAGGQLKLARAGEAEHARPHLDDRLGGNTSWPEMLVNHEGNSAKSGGLILASAPAVYSALYSLGRGSSGPFYPLPLFVKHPSVARLLTGKGRSGSVHDASRDFLVLLPATRSNALRAPALGPDLAKYQLIVFDFDGTLADTFPWFATALNDAAERYRFNRVESAEHDALRGSEPWQILERLGLSTWKLFAVARYLRARMSEDVGRISLFSGIPELLESLCAAGSVLALVSSNSESNVRAVLGPQNAARFSFYGCGASLFGKASKVKRALARTSTAPSRAILVGDEIRDSAAARDCGMAFGAVAWGYNTAAALRAHGPTEEFGSVADMLAKLR